MARMTRPAIALVIGLGLLAAMAWFDAVVVVEARLRASALFDSSQLDLLRSLGAFAVAGSVLIMSRLALGSGSVVVGTIYVIVGGFFALLPWILSTFATYVNDVPPPLPEPVAIALAQIYVQTIGPLQAVVIVGAGMAIAGAMTLVRSLRDGGTPSTN